MKKVAAVLNWVMLVLFGAAFLEVGRYSGAVGLSSLLLLAPYGTALLAFRSGKGALIGSGLFLNIAMGCLAFFHAAFGIMVDPIRGLLVMLLMLPPPILNFLLLKAAWQRTRDLPAAKEPWRGQ